MLEQKRKKEQGISKQLSRIPEETTDFLTFGSPISNSPTFNHKDWG